MKKNTALFAIFGLILAGCAGTTVVLVPDAAGKVGKVSVKTQAGQQVLSESGASTFADTSGEAPTQVEVLNSTKIQRLFGTTLANEPAAPLHYSFYFQSGSADLLPGAKLQLNTVFKAIQNRKSCDISIIGHSDSVGDNSTNQGISLKRAEAVATGLKEIGLIDKCLDIRYYGENDPAVPTADNVDEPRNRRVEVEVR